MDKWIQNCIYKHQKLIAYELMHSYPNFNSEIYTDTRKSQLGEVIVQQSCPVTFFCKILLVQMTKYSIAECKLSSVVETQVGVKKILWGENITVYMDHALADMLANT